MKAKKQAYRWGMYLLGLLSLALGITLNTKCGLGVSPIISVAYSAALILNLKVGDTTMVLYAAFVVVELGTGARRGNMCWIRSSWPLAWCLHG